MDYLPRMLLSWLLITQYSKQKIDQGKGYFPEGEKKKVKQKEAQLAILCRDSGNWLGGTHDPI